MFGIGLLGIFLTRFFIEIIKKDQEAFEADMLLNMGQLLSLPFIAMAIYVLWRAAQGSFPIGVPATKSHNANKSKTKRK
jgi:prolipoprotein diacylglyceryltransferase